MFQHLKVRHIIFVIKLIDYISTLDEASGDTESQKNNQMLNKNQLQRGKSHRECEHVMKAGHSR